MKHFQYYILLLFCIFCIGCSQTKKKPIYTNNEKPTSNVFTDTITVIPYDIPAQRFDETAQTLCHATGCFIETDLSKTGSTKVNAVKGKISIIEAVKMAIKGTNLEITEQTPNKIKIELKEL